MTNPSIHTIEVPGATIEIIKRRRSFGYDREYFKAPRMYVKVSDESILDNLANRRRRPYNVYKTMIYSSDVPRVLGIKDKLRWSQSAGCDCGCSPGFVLWQQSLIIDDEYVNYYDVWVTLHGAPAVDERKAPRVLAGV